MIKFIKNYRKNPKRTVVTFSYQKKFILNRLGDLIQKNDEKMIEEYKQIELDQMGNFSVHPEEGYVLEGTRHSDCEEKGNGLKEKRKQIEAEQAQILERDNCKRAFKENYHIKPLDYGEDGCKSAQKKALAKEKDMRGGVVCEKSYKILLCDLLAGIGVAILLVSLLFKAKTTRK